ncbi:MAG: UpxY family transcription antiterminator [Saprospiraceae bacterium]
MASTLAKYQNSLSENTARWFAVLTKVKSEKFVGKQLSEKSISNYVPLQKVTRIYGRKRRTVLLPLIYRYIFVHITRQEYIRVLETLYVEGFVKFNQNLVAIPDHEIDWLQRITGENIEFNLEGKPFALGDEVQVVYGNLTGLKGKLIKSLSKNELLIELDHIGIGLRIQIDPAHLQLVR